MHFSASDVNGWPMRIVMACIHSGDRGLSWDGMLSGLSGTRGADDACGVDIARDRDLVVFSVASFH